MAKVIKKFQAFVGAVVAAVVPTEVKLLGIYLKSNTTGNFDTKKFSVSNFRL
jgi:hypothetical protein